jgi:hypothetical protein
MELRRLAALQRMMQRMVTIDDAPDSIRAAQARRFAEHELDPRDAEALSTTDYRKLFVYRKLVRGTFIECVRLEIPLTAARLGERYQREVHAFCSAELPRSPILRDAAYELVAWALPRWRNDSELPPWLGDLARFELFDFDVHCAERNDVEPTTEELPADLPVLFDGSCRLGRFDWAVHDLPDDPDDRSEPRADATGILSYRDTHNDVRRLTLTPLATRIFELLLIDREPLANAVRLGCEREGRTLDASVIEGISSILADLAERGALRGADGRGNVTDRPPWLGWLYDARSA